jgi:hypothetical protein
MEPALHGRIRQPAELWPQSQLRERKLLLDRARAGVARCRFKTGYSFLQGQSSTNEITTPLANPFNGFTELFANTPNVGTSHRLEALYGTVSGAIQPLGGTTAIMTFYDYHSDSNRIHYGRESDWQPAYKIKRVSPHWGFGSRFGCYWADQLYTNALHCINRIAAASGNADTAPPTSAAREPSGGIKACAVSR